MKKMKNLFAIIALVGVLGIGNAFAGPITTPGAPNPRPVVSSFAFESLFANLYEYMKDIFASDNGTVTNEATGTFTRK